MSRRSDCKRDIHGGVSQRADAKVRLECPHGHTIGYLYCPGASGPTMVSGQHRGSALNRFRTVKGIQPLRFHCYPCFHSTGMELDLRLSQARAEQLLQDVLADPDHREHPHVLGG
jgi:hypothetical protein